MVDESEMLIEGGTEFVGNTAGDGQPANDQL